MDKQLERISAAMLSAVQKSLERMAFEEVETPEKAFDQAIFQQNVLWASIEIREPFKGNLMLIAPEKSALRLSESVYGMGGGELPKEKVTDAVAEMANTLVGWFIRELFGDRTHFRIGIPTTGAGEPPGCDYQTLSAHYYRVGGCEIKIVLCGEGFEEKSIDCEID